jgi:hypothetical protein
MGGKTGSKCPIRHVKKDNRVLLVSVMDGTHAFHGAAHLLRVAAARLRLIP